MAAIRGRDTCTPIAGRCTDAVRSVTRPSPPARHRSRVRRQEIAPVAEELDRTKSFPYEIVRRLGELDLMGIPFPEEYGGGGGDSLAYALAVEELARIDSSVAITLCAHTSLGTQPIYLFGSEEQKQEWLPRLCSGRAAGRVRADRARGGLGRRQHPDASRLEDGEWVINGVQAVHHQRRHRHLGAGGDHRGHRRPARQRRGERSRTCSFPTGPRATSRASRTARWAGTPRTRARCRSPTAASPSENLVGAARRRACASSSTSWTSAGSASRRWVSAWRRAHSTRHWPTRRSAARSASRSRVPVDPGQAGRHVDGDRGDAGCSFTRPRG